VEYWLLNCTGYTNRRTADEIGVSHVTVEDKRQKMESVGQIDQLDKLEGKDGKMYNRTKLAEETDLTRQYVGELMTGKAGNLSDSWGRIFDELGLELVLQPKSTGNQ
jgi:hypothetical protein